MKALVACEESQISCKILREMGIEAYSCDIKPCSGGRYIHNSDRIEKGKEAATFFMKLYDAPIKYICIENPRPIRLFNLPKPTCTVTPYMFGDKWSKRTYLWCRNLPSIMYTCENPNFKSWVFSTRGSTNRSKSNEVMYREILKQFIDYIINAEHRNFGISL